MPKVSEPVKQLSRGKCEFLTEPHFAPECGAMSTAKTPPQLSEKGLTEAELRRQRQAEALRANLARRKTQLRGRVEDEATPPQPPKTQD